MFSINGILEYICNMGTAASIAVFWAIFFAVTLSTYLIYYKLNFHPKTWSYLDTYPFKCYKCMTTWSLIAAYIMAAFLMQNVWIGIFGTAIGALYGIGIAVRERE